jgi:hypothetical protein
MLLGRYDGNRMGHEFRTFSRMMDSARSGVTPVVASSATGCADVLHEARSNPTSETSRIRWILIPQTCPWGGGHNMTFRPLLDSNALRLSPLDGFGYPSRVTRELSPLEISDRLLINDLLDAYAAGCDAKDWDLVRTLFAPDAVLDYTASGGPKGSVDQVVPWLEKSLSLFVVTQHHITNRRIALEGETARARSLLFNPLVGTDANGAPTLTFVGGYYNDRFARTAGGWLITHRVQENAWFGQGRWLTP